MRVLMTMARGLNGLGDSPDQIQGSIDAAMQKLAYWNNQYALNHAGGKSQAEFNGIVAPIKQLISDLQGQLAVAEGVGVPPSGSPQSAAAAAAGAPGNNAAPTSAAQAAAGTSAPRASTFPISQAGMFGGMNLNTWALVSLAGLAALILKRQRR